MPHRAGFELRRTSQGLDLSQPAHQSVPIPAGLVHQTFAHECRRRLPTIAPKAATPAASTSLASIASPMATASNMGGAAAAIAGPPVGADSRDPARERRRLDTANIVVAWRTHNSRGEEMDAFVPRGVRPVIRIV